MESATKEIQSWINECIQSDLTTLTDSLSLKLQYLDNEQRKLFLHQELFSVTDILVQLRKNKIIDSLFEYTDNPDFLWSSTLIENLTHDEKKKLQNFNLSLFDLNQYKTQNHFYDEGFPYFSQIVRFIVYSKYIHLLKNELEFNQTFNSTIRKNLNSVENKALLN